MHRNAPLTEEGRRRLCQRIESGWSVSAAAESMNISRQCAHKWWRRYQLEGPCGLGDRSSRPHTSPRKTPARVERRIVALRQSRKLGPARLAGLVDVPPSTVHRVLVRHGCSRLKWMDRPTGRVVRRIEASRPGELVHIDVKKLARIPDGGGWRANGRENRSRNGRADRPMIGYTYVHSAIDAYSRLAYSEILGAESEGTCVPFLARAHAFFANEGIEIERVLTDIQAGLALGSASHPAGGTRIWVTGACPPPLLTDRSVRPCTTPRLLTTGRTGATPRRRCPIENPVAGA